MDPRPPGELNIATQFQGGAKRLSAASHPPVSAKAGTVSPGHPSPEGSTSNLPSSSTIRQRPPVRSRRQPELLTDADVQKFQVLYKARFGRDITRQDAYEQGLKLLRLMELVYQPMTEEEHRRVQERRRDAGPT